MPRKRSLTYNKPSSPAHPSLLPSDKSTNSESRAEASSVNDQLQRLRQPRRGDGSRPFEAPPSHTVHPSLQTILQIPDAPPPRPRPGLRVTGGRRIPAGPPPPDSWLASRSTERRQSGSVKPERLLTDDFKAPVLPGYDIPASGTLLSSALNQLARDWEFHFEYDQYYLATIPVRYKELLLHFITLQRPYTIDRASLERLFLDETELEGATGAVDLVRLDLATSIGRSLRLRDLKAFFIPHHKPEYSAVNGVGDTDTSLPSDDLVPESWDSPALLENPSLHIRPRLTTLTHLSLSNPSPSISWSALLRHLLPCLPSQSLTHLSLAFWPFPTLTPNSLTATSFSPAGHVQAGGSNFYSAYDSDWTEPALILRRVARATLGLKWLDLTGNWPWIQALADAGFDWSGGGSWADLETLVVGQGWKPSCFSTSVSTTFDDQEGSAISYLSTPEGRALREWISIEHASLDFERKFKSRLKQAVKMSSGVNRNDQSENNWATPSSSPAVARSIAAAQNSAANGRISSEQEACRNTNPERRKGIQFERGWSENENLIDFDEFRRSQVYQLLQERQ